MKNWRKHPNTFFVKFLNHLCDEEHLVNTLTGGYKFLNHLGDEELGSNRCENTYCFLNHLGDEELPVPKENGISQVSKSSMR